MPMIANPKAADMLLGATHLSDTSGLYHRKSQSDLSLCSQFLEIVRIVLEPSLLRFSWACHIFCCLLFQIIWE